MPFSTVNFALVGLSEYALARVPKHALGVKYAGYTVYPAYLVSTGPEQSEVLYHFIKYTFAVVDAGAGDGAFVGVAPTCPVDVGAFVGAFVGEMVGSFVAGAGFVQYANHAITLLV